MILRLWSLKIMRYLSKGINTPLITYNSTSTGVELLVSIRIFLGSEPIFIRSEPIFLGSKGINIRVDTYISWLGTYISWFGTYKYRVQHGLKRFFKGSFFDFDKLIFKNH